MCTKTLERWHSMPICQPLSDLVCLSVCFNTIIAGSAPAYLSSCLFAAAVLFVFDGWCAISSALLGDVIQVHCARAESSGVHQLFSERTGAFCSDACAASLILCSWEVKTPSRLFFKNNVNASCEDINHGRSWLMHCANSEESLLP